jgi:DNA-binding transcriptional MerR regulator
MDKSPEAFRTISEVAEDLDLPQHVLRFWETRFGQIRPLKRAGGRRYYRPEDVDLLKGIRHLLYREGYTIKGVQRILKAEGVRFVQAVGRGEQAVEPDPEADAPEAEGAPIPAERPSPEERLPADLLGAAALSPGDVERLREALDDLLECERLLGTLRGEAPDALAEG